MGETRDEADRRRTLRRSNIRFALAIGVVAVGFYLLMFVTAWKGW